MKGLGFRVETDTYLLLCLCQKEKAGTNFPVAMPLSVGYLQRSIGENWECWDRKGTLGKDESNKVIEENNPNYGEILDPLLIPAPDLEIERRS